MVTILVGNPGLLWLPAAAAGDLILFLLLEIDCCSKALAVVTQVQAAWQLSGQTHEALQAAALTQLKIFAASCCTSASDRYISSQLLKTTS